MRAEAYEANTSQPMTSKLFQNRMQNGCVPATPSSVHEASPSFMDLATLVLVQHVDACRTRVQERECSCLHSRQHAHGLVIDRQDPSGNIADLLPI